jgi:hypothetical protein
MRARTRHGDGVRHADIEPHRAPSVSSVSICSTGNTVTPTT